MWKYWGYCQRAPFAGSSNQTFDADLIAAGDVDSIVVVVAFAVDVDQRPLHYWHLYPSAWHVQEPHSEPSTFPD